MTVKVEQLYEAETKAIDARGEFTEVEIHYIVFGVDKEAEALEAIRQKLLENIYDDSMPTYGVLPLERIEIDERCNETTFKATAIYRRISSSDNYKDTDDDDKDEPSTVSFDCGGGTRHVTHSVEQKRVVGTKDAGGYIGWDGKTDSISGVDVPTAQFRETYTANKKIKDINTRYKRLVGSLVGTVNYAPFKGWNKGEVMFLGMSYNAPEKGRKKVTVTYNFMIQPNEENAKVGGVPVGFVEGFQYIWALHKTTVAENKAPKVEVEAVYVETVCQYGNFSALGI